MSSLPRRMQRKFARKNNPTEVKPDVVINGDTHYARLHPTKGWKIVSYARMYAAQRMARLLDHS